MSILVDHEIHQFIRQGFIKIDPFEPELINPNSIDIRLGHVFSTHMPTVKEYEDAQDTPANFNPDEELPKEPVYHIVSPQDKTTFQFISNEVKGNIKNFVLQPYHFVCASLLEDITLSPVVCAEIRGKSSLGRLGLMNSSVAGWVDAGWSGILTIELFNYSSFPIKLTPGMKIGQMVFHRTEKTPDRPYGMVGRYQRQAAGEGSKGL